MIAKLVRNQYPTELDRWVDGLFRDVGLVPFRGRALGAFAPSINVTENEQEVQVSAELPGVDEKDIHVSLDENVLVITGEKKNEQEHADGANTYVEHSYGSFQRAIPLRAEVDGRKAKAKFKQGVLTISLPKAADEKAKRIAINVSAN